MKELKTRRSVRNYNLDKKLTYEELVDICKIATCAPTARNQRPWNFIIIDDNDVINKLSEACKGSLDLKKCNTYIALLGHVNPMGLTAPGMEPCDLAAAQMNMITYARSKNLGTCWIGGFSSNERIENMNKILNVPADYYVYSLLAVGYPSDLSCFYEQDRFDINMVHHNKF